VDNRYYYLDADGQVQGPFWLSVMRDLWAKGRFTMRTEVSLNGSTDWQRIEFHPEIYDTAANLPAFHRMARAKSDPVRLLIWTFLLLLAYGAYLLVNMDSGKKPAPTPARAPATGN
jgi:GYF domain 2